MIQPLTNNEYIHRLVTMIIHTDNYYFTKNAEHVEDDTNNDDENEAVNMYHHNLMMIYIYMFMH